jgi:hypothetical protein
MSYIPNAWREAGQIDKVEVKPKVGRPPLYLIQCWNVYNPATGLSHNTSRTLLQDGFTAKDISLEEAKKHKFKVGKYDQARQAVTVYYTSDKKKFSSYFDREGYRLSHAVEIDVRDTYINQL